MKFGFRVARQGLVALSIAATCGFACGCSATTFPTVLADPPPPTDNTLTPDQVKQAMDNLISARNHQCAEATAEAAPGALPPDCAAAVTTGSTPNGGAAAKP